MFDALIELSLDVMSVVVLSNDVVYNVALLESIGEFVWVLERAVRVEAV